MVPALLSSFVLLVSSANAGSRAAELEGLVAPSRQVTLGAPTEGMLLEVPVEEGQAVTTGALLARMDDRVQQVAVEEARFRAESEGEIAAAQLELERADLDLQAVRQSHEAQAATDRELRTAQNARDRAEVGVDLAVEAQKLHALRHRLEQERLALFRVTAPFDGLVVRAAQEPGASLKQSDPILVLVDMDPLEATLHLPAAMMRQLEPGGAYRLEAGEPVNRTLSATLKHVDPVIDPASQTVRCVLTIANPELALPAGFRVWLAGPDTGAPVEASH